MRHVPIRKEEGQKEREDDEQVNDLVGVPHVAERFLPPGRLGAASLWVGGWVGGWVAVLGEGERGGWNEVLEAMGGWMGGGERGGWNELLKAMGGWVVDLPCGLQWSAARPNK